MKCLASALFLCLATFTSVMTAHATTQLGQNLEAGKPQTVVCYGTSLTHKGQWVKDLDAALQAQFPGQATVINSGQSGMHSGWGRSHLQERVLDKHPDTVIIEFSMNDACERFKINPEKARENLNYMIDQILGQNPDCEIILMTMTLGDKHPVGHQSYRLNIEDHYAMYRDVAQERGFLLIDHYPNWQALQQNDPETYKRYVPDSIHPTPKGNTAIVSPVVIEAIGLETNPST